MPVKKQIYKSEDQKYSEKMNRETIKKWLHYNGFKQFWVWQGKYSYRGISDLIVIKNGIVLFIEIKSTIGKQTVEQMVFGCDIQSQKGHYVVARTYQDVSDYITKNNLHKVIFDSPALYLD